MTRTIVVQPGDCSPWLAPRCHWFRYVLLENLALRQQLATLAHRRRPRLKTADRYFWVALRAVWTEWPAALAIVKPATVVAWHRRAYRAYWRRVSRKPGRPRTDAQLRDLISRMVTENRWGAPRIHGELLKLGFRVSERTGSSHDARRLRAGFALRYGRLTASRGRPSPSLPMAKRRLSGADGVLARHTVWEGDVEVFRVRGHPKAQLAYAWTYKDDDGTLQHVAVLGVPPIGSPQEAVQAVVMAHMEKQRQKP